MPAGAPRAKPIWPGGNLFVRVVVLVGALVLNLDCCKEY
jgi:hypothetical protein